MGVDIYKNKKAELRAWAKDDIVPSDLQWLCGVSADLIDSLQTENARLRTNAGAFVIWSAKFDSVNIKDMREFLETLKGK